jgi:hypothetical protein
VCEVWSEVEDTDECQALKGYPKWALLMSLLSLGNNLLLVCSKCAPWDPQDTKSREQSRNIQTHIDIQDLVSGTFCQKGLPSCAGNLVWTLVDEHGTSTLVPPGTVNRPVPIDDGAARATSQCC